MRNKDLFKLKAAQKVEEEKMGKKLPDFPQKKMSDKEEKRLKAQAAAYQKKRKKAEEERMKGIAKDPKLQESFANAVDSARQ